MRVVLVTGAAGFLGAHLVEALRRRQDTRVIEHDIDSPTGNLEFALRECHVIFHLAGVNRPQDPSWFQRCNVDLTVTLCDMLVAQGRRPTLVLSSSIQAALDNAYGISKRGAEETVEKWSTAGYGRGIVFRLKNVFGKWCRPNYNSVTATFCHNIAHDLPITISDPARELDLVYIDDVVEAMVACLDHPPAGAFEYREVERSYLVTLGELAERIRGFRESRATLLLPRSDDEFGLRLYVTYLSYLEGAAFAYDLEKRTDARGTLAEFVKSPQAGQIFVSRTNPGVIRGNHYHHSKAEKFLVLEGLAVVRFRRYGDAKLIEHRVAGGDFRVIDIPPGYAHSIENVGTGELVTLFWASEIFDPCRPDTIAMPVLP